MIELRSGDRRAAFDVPFHVYGAASPYVSPMWSDFDRFLDSAKNPLAREGRGAFALFTAHRDGRPVGRIVAAMHEASNRRHGTRRGQFGFFDCADDPDAANVLLGGHKWLPGRALSTAPAVGCSCCRCAPSPSPL